MPLLVLAFVAGVWWLQCQPALPSLPLLICLFAGAAAMAVVAWYWRSAGLRSAGLLACAVLAGIVWAALRADWRLDETLPAGLEGQDVQISGTIASMPQQMERGWRFDFAVNQPSPVPPRIGLAWYTSGYRGEVPPVAVPPLHAGDRWQLTVRLKRPHGNANPHGFDYEAWLFERGIRATGYVRTKGEHKLLEEESGFFVERQREAIRSRFASVLSEREYGGVLTALAVGDQQAIPRSQWEIFSRTGLTHLMSISGLHITMLAGLAYGLVNLLWRRSTRLMQRLPAQQAAIVGGLCAATAYCFLAGFAVPAQRTLYMLAIVGIALWQRRHLAVTVVLAWALLAVVVVDPWAVLAAGFWLSFGAVALLFYAGSGRIRSIGWLATWVRAQWAITLGMIPLLLALFQQFSLVSPLANAVAIPLISLVITPMTLLATIPGFEFLLLPAHDLLALLMRGMIWLAEFPQANWQQAAQPWWLICLGLGGALWLLLPRGFPARWLGLLPLLALLLAPPQRPAHGEMDVTTLDVGQGLAVHVQTAGHDLLFDTGPAFSEEANSGNRIILPYLRAKGVTMLDGLIVTHADNDHAGGAESVIEGMPVAWMMTSAPLEHRLSALPVTQSPCVAGGSWEWDGVRFDILHPDVNAYARESVKTNDMSCVLKLTAAGGSMLLTADIEMRSERELLARSPAALEAGVLLVPHHGSKTSSSAEFIDAVGARAAIFPVGYRNHYRHPHPDVTARYTSKVAELYRTDRDGAVIVRYSAGKTAIDATRRQRRRYWHGQ